MKKVILPLALGVTLLGIGLTNQTTSFAQGKTSPKIVQTAKNSAPAFKLKNKKGKTVSLSAYKGKKVYINVWATWCGPCMREIPDLEKIYQTYKHKKDFVFLSVTSPNDSKYKNGALIQFFTIIRTILPKHMAFVPFQLISLSIVMAVFRKKSQEVLMRTLLNIT